MTTSLTITVIENDGTIDESAMVDDFTAQLTALKADRSSYVAKITDALNGAFDRQPVGTKFLLNHLVLKVLQTLDPSPNEFTKWENRVLDFIRSNCKGDNSLLEMTKGAKNPGIARRVKLSLVKGVQ